MMMMSAAAWGAVLAQKKKLQTDTAIVGCREWVFSDKVGSLSNHVRSFWKCSP